MAALGESGERPHGRGRGGHNWGGVALNRPPETARFLEEDLRAFWEQRGRTFVGSFLRDTIKWRGTRG